MSTLTQSPALTDTIATACARVAPLWPLKNFVAVNPFVGLADHNFLDSCALVRRVAHGDMTMPLSYYAAKWKTGQIGETDLQRALELAAQTWPHDHARAIENWTAADLIAALDTPDSAIVTDAIFTVADALDELNHTQWRSFMLDEISKWCSAYYDAGQASWKMPWAGDSLFAAWKGAALCDANPEMMGLHDFRAFVAQLPDEPTEIIEMALEQLEIPAESAADFLHRELMFISGWSGYVQYQAREAAMYGGHDDSLQHLLAIQLAHEVALYGQHTSDKFRDFWQQKIADLAAGARAQPDELAVLTPALWQLAAESAHQNALIEKMRTTSCAAQPTRAAVQMVFCIDVRSEVLRRALEATSPAIETVGFAGFFGFPIEFVAFGQNKGSVQCPVLLTPPFRIEESLTGAAPSEIADALKNKRFSQRLTLAWNSFKTSAVSCFSFVETGGILSGVKLVKHSLGLSSHGDGHDSLAPCVNCNEDGHSGMTLEQQITVAASALKNMGLTTNLARLVIICGHGAQTENNPYGSGLDCGACGGNSGQANARVAATVLNAPAVRAGLAQLGIDIPDDTHFVAALHNTTTDDVTLFDQSLLPTSHQKDWLNLQDNLKIASAQTRRERAPRLGLGAVADAEIDEKVRARSHDWAQTRPEWGLAGNASYIVAPRARTKGLDLGGRAFLNNYDYTSDPDLAKLELVMTAPMVVGVWINMQYFASTVNNRHFGSGNKTIHNVVGTMGIWEGNCGDLQVGLPLQSVHDGHNWMHEPLRLSVFIEAPATAIDAILIKHDNVRELLDNGWLHLIAIEDDGQTMLRYCGDGEWAPVGV